MKISLIHPSRNRPQLAAQTAKKWLSSAKERGRIEYVLSIDTTETHENKIAYSEMAADLMLVHDNKTAIEAINRAAAVCTGDLMVVMSDDFDCPFGWDEALVNTASGKSDFIIKTEDYTTNQYGQVQGQPWIITLPIMDRVYYSRFEYVYYPHYLHLFSDTEMTHVADLLDRKITSPIRFPHRHYSSGNTPKDAVNEKNDATWSQGEALYLERMARNFDLPESDIKGVLRCHSSHAEWLKCKGVLIQMAA